MSVIKTFQLTSTNLHHRELPTMDTNTPNTETTATSAQPDHPAALKEIKANFDTLIDIVPIKFNFKKKDDTEDESGVTIPGTKRPTLELDLPVLSVEGIVSAMQRGGKELDLVREAVNDVIIARARQIINDDESVTTETFPYKDISWEAIANLPKAERRGGGISKETWAEFLADYIAIMPAAANKKVEAVGRAAKVFEKKFSDVKTDKKVLTLLREQLTIYINHSPRAEEFEECLKFLFNKANTLLSTESSSLLEAL